MEYKVGDRVKVNCPGLAQLREIVPDMPPNHHGTVDEILEGGGLMILFDDTKSVAPYMPDECERLNQ